MKRGSIILIVLLLGLAEVFAKVSTTFVSDTCANTLTVYSDTTLPSHRIPQQPDSASVYFRINQYNIDPDYMGNATTLQHLSQVINMAGTQCIDSIVIRTQSSPEGPLKYNLRLAEQRALSMRNYIATNHPDVSSKIVSFTDGESWNQLRESVKKDSLLKQESIDKIIAIIDADVNIDTKKWRMQQLPVYRYLISTWYPRIRNSVTCIIYHSERDWDAPAADVIKSLPKDIEIQALKAPSIITDFGLPLLMPADAWTRHIYLKTNLAAWGMAISNIACEVDLAPHWSLTLPINYSAWNFGRSTLKFRTFAILPEARYWLNRESEGLFFGVHAGFIYYNFAFNGNYRYQDHNGCSPAWGGGVNAGYRIALDALKRWHMEFALGGGVYDLHYDTFHNVDNGRFDNTYHDTYWGIDQVGITISYRFDLDKKGGRR